MLENSNIKTIEDEKQYYDEKFKSISMRFYAYLNKHYSAYASTGNFIKLKFEHTARVVQYADKIARSENVSEEDVYIAKLVALFHDLGHFEERKRKILETKRKEKGLEEIKELKKVGEDHADLSVKMLFDNILDDDANILYNDNRKSLKLIDQFMVDEKYHNIIRVAIENHSKIVINEEELDDRTLFHAQCIRDADKIDITNVRRIPEFGLLPKKNHKISDGAWRYFEKGELMNFNEMNERGEKREGADLYINTVLFVLHMYYPESIKIISDEEIIQSLYDLCEYTDPVTKNRVDKVFSLIFKKMEKYLSEYSRTESEYSKTEREKQIFKGSTGYSIDDRGDR